MSNSDPVPQPATKPAPGSDLMPRVISAIIMAAVILVATWVGGWPFRIIWAVVGGLVAHEWLTIIGQPRLVAIAGAMCVAALGIVAPFLPLGAVAAAFAAVALGIWLASGPHAMPPAGVAYGAVIALAPALMRDVPQLGLWLIGWSFAVVWCSDVAAYFTGRALGGPKLMPRVSPKKTWSGAIGGLIAGVAGGLAVDALARRSGVAMPLDVIMVGVISCVATVLGQMGDLAESALKRHYDVKDSSQMIPGHGGFMDRLDAYLPVVALAATILLLAR